MSIPSPTNALATTPGPGPLAQQEAKQNEVKFKPWGAEDEIKLNVTVIRDIIAAPYFEAKGDQIVEHLPDSKECIKFLMLCRAQRCDPFTGDAYMVPFWDRKLNKPVWSLITSISCFRKRAEDHPKYDGMSSGVIVLTGDDEVKEREGDFLYPEDRLLGGWARVDLKDRKNPTVRKVNLSTFNKGWGQWKEDPAGMIVKVAEAHALRDSFPTLLGGLKVREESIDVDATVQVSTAQRPDFARGLPAPDLTQRTLPAPKAKAPTKIDQPRQEAQKEATAQRQAAPAASQAQATAPQPAPQQTTAQAPAEAQGEAPQNQTEPAEGPDDEAALAAAGLAPVPEQEQGESQATDVSEVTIDPELAVTAKDTQLSGEVKKLAARDGLTLAQLMKFLISKLLAKDGQKLHELHSKKLQSLVESWDRMLPIIKQA